MAELTPEAKAIQTVHNKHVKDLQEALNSHVKALGGSVIDGAGTVDANTGLVKKGTSRPNSRCNRYSNPLEAVKESFGIKDFFSNMFSSFTSGFSSMFSGMMGGLGGIGSSIMSIFGLERGGVIGLARGNDAKICSRRHSKTTNLFSRRGKNNTKLSFLYLIIEVYQLT